MSSDRLPNNELGRSFLEKYTRALTEVRKDVIKLEDVIEQIYIAVLSDGHVILEGEPGVGKTLVVNTIARTIAAKRSRIQFNPETLPSDLYYSIGSFDEEGGGKTLREVRLAPGPLFTQILVGDEINRATARTSTGLLEALEEKQITIEGRTISLGDFYFFAATQNPVETAESTNDLPEALMERLLLMVHVPYPRSELLRRIAVHDTRKKEIEEEFSAEEIVELQNAIFEQYVLGRKENDPVIRYIQRIITTIHSHKAVTWGPGIRAIQDLTRAAASHAFLHGHDHITFNSIRAMAGPTLRFKFNLDQRKSRALEIKSNDQVIREVLSSIPLLMPLED